MTTADNARTTPDHPMARRATLETHASELERAAVPRLRLLAKVFFALLVLMLIAVRLVDSGVLEVPQPGRTSSIVLWAALVGSLALVCVTYAPWPPRRILAIGTAYQIYGAFCVAYI